jgi:hypothetical protein
MTSRVKAFLSPGFISGARVTLCTTTLAVAHLSNCFTQAFGAQLVVTFAEDFPSALFAILAWAVLNVLKVS